MAEDIRSLIEQISDTVAGFSTVGLTKKDLEDDYDVILEDFKITNDRWWVFRRRVNDGEVIRLEQFFLNITGTQEPHLVAVTKRKKDGTFVEMRHRSINVNGNLIHLKPQIRLDDEQVTGIITNIAASLRKEKIYED